MPTTDLPDEPLPEKPARAPKKPFTAEEIKDLAETLSLPEVNGNLAAAAAKLKAKYPDSGYMRWYKIKESNDYLRAQHPSMKPEDALPSTAQVINRAPLVFQPEIDEAQAIVKQAELLSSGDWQSIGITEEQAERMVSMERFSRKPLRQMAEAAHGGLLFAYANCLDLLGSSLKSVREPETELDGKGNERSRQAVVRDNMYASIAVSGELRQLSKEISHTLLVMHKVSQMEADSGGKGKGHGKPGFGPMVAVKAEAGATVTITDGKSA